VKRGRGPRSSRIDILSLAPRITEEQVRLPSGESMRAPRLDVLNILTVAADPADIGAPEQRMVHAHLERLTVNAAGK
jgi:hypothetical protein